MHYEKQTKLFIHRLNGDRAYMKASEVVGGDYVDGCITGRIIRHFCCPGREILEQGVQIRSSLRF